MNQLALTWLIRLALAVAFLGAGAAFGYRYADNACKARKSEAQTVAIEQHDEAAVVGQTVERETVKRTVKTEAVFNGIQLGVIDYAQKHPAATDCRLDDDGLRLWHAANANAEPLPAAERDAAMRDAGTAAERGDDGSIEQSHRSRQGLSPVPGSASGSGELAGED